MSWNTYLKEIYDLSVSGKKEEAKALAQKCEEENPWINTWPNGGPHLALRRALNGGPYWAD